MRLFVAIPTVGRAGLIRRTVPRLREQTRPPDGVLVVGAEPADVEGLEAPDLPLRIELAERGSCRQRNHALRRLAEDSDLIVFFDDDFVPSTDFLAKVEALFEASPGVVGACGLVLHDGACGPGISFEEAGAILARYRAPPSPLRRTNDALYGCNMALRTSALKGLSFDEELPLYGWQEDIDFSVRLSQRGELVEDYALTGVHMGIKSGRTPGKKLGYSQIANPIYLLGKRTIPPSLAWRLLVSNPLANLAKAWRPEPYIDRKGRLLGNLLALRDLVTGRMHPRRILDLA